MKSSARLYGLLVLTMAIWAGTFVVGRVLAQQLPTLSLAFWRFAIAALCLFILLARTPGGLTLPPPRAWPWLLGLALSGVYAYNLLFFAGLAEIPASRAALLVALNPALTALASALLLRHPIGAVRWAGLALSLIGVLTVVSHGDWGQIAAGGVGRGEILIFGCCLSWVSYTLLSRGAMAYLSGLAAIAWAALTGAVLLGLTAAWRTELVWPVGLAQWGGLGYFGALATAAGFVWYGEGIRVLGPARTIVFSNLVPVFAVLMGVLWLGESLYWSGALGGLLVVAGVALTNLPRR
ncbi:DMT family transporter [Chitinimonas lacunae]|uniref:DMT family transporter n=1 Tax=Chitinimonas lacunae TaxID=1963018 RepID=A0ABV8MX20_9NEIS